MFELIVFFFFAVTAVAFATMVILHRNPVVGAISLVFCFFSLAVMYVLLDAPFMAALQVIIYAGAIMVLFLFVIMLLNLGHDYRSDLRGGLWVVVGFLTAGLTGWAVSRAFVGETAVFGLDGAATIDASVRELNAVGAIAQPLFRDFLVAFELASVLLLVAIVGAVILAKRRV